MCASQFVGIISFPRKVKEGVGGPGLPVRTEATTRVGFPGGSVGKHPPANEGDANSIPGRGNSNPLQYSCLGKSHQQRSLAGYSPRGRKKWATT